MQEKASIETNSIVLLNTLAFGTSSQVSTSMKCNIISVTHGKGFCKKQTSIQFFVWPNPEGTDKRGQITTCVTNGTLRNFWGSNSLRKILNA